MPHSKIPTQTPEKYFARCRNSDPVYIAEVLHLTGVLVEQYRAVGVRSRYLDMLDEALADLRVHCVKTAMAHSFDFRPTMPFPAHGWYVRAGGQLDMRQLLTIELRSRFLLRLLSSLAHAKRRPNDCEGLTALLDALVVALKRVIEDSESSPNRLS